MPNERFGGHVLTLQLNCQNFINFPEFIQSVSFTSLSHKSYEYSCLHRNLKRIQRGSNKNTEVKQKYVKWKKKWNMQYFTKLSLFFSNDCSHKHLVDTVSYLQVHMFHFCFVLVLLKLLALGLVPVWDPGRFLSCVSCIIRTVLLKLSCYLAPRARNLCGLLELSTVTFLGWCRHLSPLSTFVPCPSVFHMTLNLISAFERRLPRNLIGVFQYSKEDNKSEGEWCSTWTDSERTRGSNLKLRGEI